MKQKAYIYPITNRLKTGVYNPYIDNFITSTEPYVDYLNKKHPSDTGIFNLVRFVWKADVLFLNWIENLPDKKFGLPQTLFFLFIIWFKKLFGIKVIWTLHNRISHYKEGYAIKKYIFYTLLRRSDVIITHSTEGIRLAESLLPGSISRIFYFPHPIIPFDKTNHIAKPHKEIDILIWGTISPYKGVDKFLHFLEQTNQLKRFRIVIAGKILSGEFSHTINRYASENITIKNEFISSEELALLIAKSKVVLFTYTGESVLSSGALIDSLAYRGLVLGPNLGAFADMQKSGLALTFNHFSDISGIMDELDKVNHIELAKRIEEFVQNHTWERFADSFKDNALKS